MSRPIYSTTLSRALAALCCGAATAGAGWATGLVALGATGGLEGTGTALVAAGPMAALMFIVYAIGLTLIAAPLWGLLHLWRLRTPAAATILGTVLSAVPAGLLFVRDDSPITGLAYAAFATALGAKVGWVIWRIAYRRAA